eukprot:15363767-Ditylum_brightwellii.AAC.1
MLSKQNDNNSTESTRVETNHNSLDGHGDIDSDIDSTVPNGNIDRHKQGTTAPPAEAMRKTRKSTFEEIKYLVIDNPTTGRETTKQLLTKRKLLLDGATTTSTSATEKKSKSESH